MKKVILTVISFFIFTMNIMALDNKPYLTNLEITNGVNTLNFDKYNDVYTINVYEDIDSLDISYETDSDDTYVEIVGNLLTNEVNDVYINLMNNKDTNSYHLIVNKVNDLKPVFYEVEPPSKVQGNRLMQLVIVIIYVLINFIMTKILFHKKRT